MNRSEQQDAKEPTLAAHAHLVLETTHTSTKCGNIYLGSRLAAGPEVYHEILKADIAGIVNCTPLVPCYFRNDSIKYCAVTVNDEVAADILAYLDGATMFVHAVLCTGSSVLVHCEAGVSRSATVVIAYLIRYHQMTRDEAYVHVKKRRPSINPNPGFWYQLKQFEERWCNGEALVLQDDKEKTVLNKEMNLDWCSESCSLYSTLLDIPHLLESTDCFEPLMQPVPLSVMEHYASVWLDFVWGRGLITSDLGWLAYCCAIVDRTNAVDADQSSSMTEVAISVVQDESSDFGSSWSGEIYPCQIQKVIKTLTQQ